MPLKLGIRALGFLFSDPCRSRETGAKVHGDLRGALLITSQVSGVTF